MRVAFVDKGILKYYNEDILSHERRYSNVYLGKITRIEPALHAVFVDYGENKEGFLSYYSIHPSYFRINAKEKNQLINSIKDLDHFQKNEFYNKYNLSDILRVGDKIIVQLIREQRDHKGAMLSTFISMGHKSCFSYIPNSVKEEIILVSTLPKDYKKELTELLKFGSFFMYNLPQIPRKLFLEQVARCVSTWHEILHKASINNKPTILQHSESFLMQILQHPFMKSCKKIIFEGDDMSYLQANLKDLFLDKIFSAEKGKHIFLSYENQVEEIFSPVVFLPSGGHLIFAQSAAGFTVDVNMGRGVKGHPKSCALQTNIEAADVLARQMYLRNMSGIIFLDLIDIQEKSEFIKIEEAFKSACMHDEAKIRIESITPFGTMTICRQYISRFSPYEQLSECPSCSTKCITSPERAAAMLLQKAEYLDYPMLKVNVSKEVMNYIQNYYQKEINALKLKTLLKFFVDDSVRADYYSISYK